MSVSVYMLRLSVNNNYLLNCYVGDDVNAVLACERANDRAAARNTWHYLKWTAHTRDKQNLTIWCAHFLLFVHIRLIAEILSTELWTHFTFISKFQLYQIGQYAVICVRHQYNLCLNFIPIFASILVVSIA